MCVCVNLYPRLPQESNFWMHENQILDQDLCLKLNLSLVCNVEGVSTI